MNKNNNYIITSILVFVAIFVFWELFLRTVSVSKLVIVPPSEIFPVVVSQHKIFLRELFYTFNIIIIGWLIGNLIGVVLSVLVFPFKSLSQTLTTISVFINAIPIIALTAIIGGIMGNNIYSKIFIVSLLCFFPMFIASLTGFTNIDERNRSLFKVFASSGTQTFFKLILPNGLPYIGTTAQLNVITAIFAGIVTEFFGANHGIGQLILANRGFYNLDKVWGALFYVVFAGGLFYFLITVINKYLIWWKK